MTKREIMEYLENNNIKYDEKSLKAELLEVIEKHKGEKAEKVAEKIEKIKEVKEVSVNTGSDYTGIKFMNGFYIVLRDNTAFRTAKEAAEYNGSI